MHERAARMIQERLVKLSDAVEVIRETVECSDYPATMLVWKKSTQEEAVMRLQATRVYLAGKDESWFGNLGAMEEQTRAWIVEKGWGNGDTLWPMRVALSGREKSPGPFELLFVTGKDEGLVRLDAALQKMA